METSLVCLWMRTHRPVDLLKRNPFPVVHCLSFPEETDGDSEEPESRLSWLPAPLRKPLATGCSINTVVLVFSCVFGPLCLCFSGFYSGLLFLPSNALRYVVIIHWVHTSGTCCALLKWVTTLVPDEFFSSSLCRTCLITKTRSSPVNSESIWAC